jgi:hypothetical protein
MFYGQPSLLHPSCRHYREKKHPLDGIHVLVADLNDKTRLWTGVRRGEEALRRWGSTMLGQLSLVECEQLWHELDLEVQIVKVNQTMNKLTVPSKANPNSMPSPSPSNNQADLDSADKGRMLGLVDAEKGRSPTVDTVLVQFHALLRRMHTLIPVLRDLQVGERWVSYACFEG